MMKRVFVISCLSLLGGCSLLPFHDDNACKLEGNYGKCINGEMAYEEAISGEDLFGNYIGEDGLTDVKPGTSGNTEGQAAGGSAGIHGDGFSHVKNKAFIQLKDSTYQELAALVQQPESPLLRPPKVVSTLIMNYQSGGDKTQMYMPRYVYSILRDSEFIYNQYMLRRNDHTLPSFNDIYAK